MLTATELEKLCGIAASFYGWTGYDSYTWLGLPDPDRYAAIRPRLSLNQLTEFIEQRPELCDYWIRASSEKRLPGGLVLERRKNMFVLRREESADSVLETFTTAAPATASFIISVIDAAHAPS
jgi:hypothetical protein